MTGDDWNSEESREERRHRREVLDDWRAYVKALRDADPSQRMLMREARSLGLKRREDAARTIADFEKLSIIWNDRDLIARYRIDRHEEKYDDDLPDAELPERSAVIPPPLHHVWWRQQLGGNFLDTIHDCPYEIPELTTSRPVYDYASELDGMHRELMYYWVIRQWSPQKIAAFFERTDRNIRKVYHTMIEDFRIKMYVRLRGRYWAKAPLTNAQREFCRTFWDWFDDSQRERVEHKIVKEERRQEKMRLEEARKRREQK